MAGAQRTPLHALHVALGAKLVPFAGYEMPLQYAGGIVQEHLHTRAAASLFDVSHMGQVFVDAPAEALEALVPGDLAALEAGRQRYTVLTNGQGGILDDLMVARLAGRWYVVANAAFRERDAALLAEAGSAALAGDRALLALQGPAAAAVLAPHAPRVADLAFMDVLETGVAGTDCIVSRSGYTGEDGFEIACAAERATALAETLLSDTRVAPAGLGARDSLRLEAGLCLAGTDIDETTSVVEAGLGWLVARKYRGEGAVPARFPGAARVLAELAQGAPRRRVGLRPRGRVPLRGGTALADRAGREVGRITSGSFGPSAGHPVAMGYVEPACAEAGTVLAVTIRGREHEAEVCDLPFVPHRFHRP